LLRNPRKRHGEKTLKSPAAFRAGKNTIPTQTIEKSYHSASGRDEANSAFNRAETASCDKVLESLKEALPETFNNAPRAVHSCALAGRSASHSDAFFSLIDAIGISLTPKNCWLTIE